MKTLTKSSLTVGKNAKERNLLSLIMTKYTYPLTLHTYPSTPPPSRFLTWNSVVKNECDDSAQEHGSAQHHLYYLVCMLIAWKTVVSYTTAAVTQKMRLSTRMFINPSNHESTTSPDVLSNHTPTHPLMHPATHPNPPTHPPIHHFKDYPPTDTPARNPKYITRSKSSEWSQHSTSVVWKIQLWSWELQHVLIVN